jgi:hypothetical protein
MSGFASVITPFSYGPAIQLSGNSRLWRKKVLPIGDIEYQGRTLHFTRGYIQGLERAFRDGAYDMVSFQLAPSDNAHTNDPERHRGTITDMKAEADGLWITVQPTERGAQVLTENPYLGVSARIVEQYQRADGRFYPAAIQHILGTLDPRIPGLGQWQPVDMSNSPQVTIDLSGTRWPGDPGPALTFAGDVLTDAELSDLEQVTAEVDAEELEALMQQDYGQPDFTDFDAAFTAHAQAEQYRSEARAAAIVEDTMNPARRDEDRMARLMHRAADGVYDGLPLSFAAESSAVELAVATGRGLCGTPDEWGRCSARFHDLECAHGQGVDWLASGPHPQTYENSLRSWANSINLARTPTAVYDDPDDIDGPAAVIPQGTIELAHELASDLGLDIDAPFIGAPGFDDVSSLFRAPGAPVSTADALYEGMGYGSAQPAAPSRPGIRELAERLGLR